MLVNTVRRLVTERLVLPGIPPATHEFTRRRDLPVPMDDGTVLLADLWRPQRPVDPGTPTLLVRSPYGRGGQIGELTGRIMAERGFPVLLQSVRGTFGSGGVFTPQKDEARDGAATLRWMRTQPWCTPRVATLGPSYLGYVQWALAELCVSEPDTAPDAFCLFITMPHLGPPTYHNGAFALRSALGWTRMVSTQEQPLAALTGLWTTSRRLERAFDHHPLREGDKLAIGMTNHWYQDWLTHEDVGDDYWAPQDHTPSVPLVDRPTLMVSGWSDIFLPWQIRNYRALVEAGNPPRLTVGPWGHVSLGLHAACVTEAVDFLQTTFRGVPSRRTAPVRLFVTGADEWRDYPEYPPPGVRPVEWTLQPHGGLTAGPPRASEPDRYVYDPTDPTPAVSGPSLRPTALTVDNRAHELRADVLTYTSAPLTEAVEVIGVPQASVFLGSDRECTDLFVRICDVHPDGRSMNVADGVRRVGGAGTRAVDPARDEDGVREVSLDLWPTGHRFGVGHRIRLQISSGAHPRFARNPGTGEPTGEARTMLVAHQSIWHDPEHPSRIVLPTSP